MDMPENWPDGYCTLRPEPGAHCYNKATMAVREPFTPGMFKLDVCGDCGNELIRQGYIRVKEEKL